MRTIGAALRASSQLPLRIIGEDSTRFQSVKTGEIDIYLGPLPDHLPELPKFEAPLAQEFSMVRLSNLEGSSALAIRAFVRR